jgi:predicted phosphodiesterase
MRVFYASDLHLEFGPFELEPKDVDLVILAGDIHTGLRGVRWAMRSFGDTPVVYVLGNHEYYRQAWPRLVEKVRNLTRNSNVHLLEQDSFSLGGVTFLGCTLWTDNALHGDVWGAGLKMRSMMSDYHKIRVSPEYRRLLPSDTTRIHAQSRSWLQSALEACPGTTVVITHHAPSQRSLSPSYRDDPLSPAYASDLDELILSSGPNLWIHGHTHRTCDYRVGSTRVLCNPRGYPDEPVPGFDPDIALEVT